MIADAQNKTTSRSIDTMKIVGGLILLAVTMGLSTLVEITWPQIPFHSVVEAVGSLSLIVLALVLIRSDRKMLVPGARIFGLGLYLMGVADLLHSFVAPGNLFVWFHSLALFSGGLVAMLVWLNSDEWENSINSAGLIFAMTALLLIIGCLSVLAPGYVPAMLENGKFSFGASVLNLGGGLGFACAAAWFFMQNLRKPNGQLMVFFGVSILNSSAGLLFNTSELWSFDWWVWHLFRLLAAMIALGYMAFLARQTLLAAGERDQLQILLGQVRQQQAELEAASRKREEKSHLSNDFLAVSELSEIGEILLKNLARTCNVQAGVFYVCNKDKQLNPVATHAHPNPDHIAGKIPFGYGLAGAAAEQKKAVLVDDLPENYMALESGMLTVPLKQVYCFPFLNGKQVVAVVELGSIVSMNEESLELLSEIEPIVVTKILSLDR